MDIAFFVRLTSRRSMWFVSETILFGISPYYGNLMCLFSIPCTVLREFIECPERAGVEDLGKEYTDPATVIIPEIETLYTLYTSYICMYIQVHMHIHICDYSNCDYIYIYVYMGTLHP